LATRVPARLSRAAGRRFGLTLGVAFAALSAALWWRGHAAAAPLVATLAGLLLLAALVAPTRLGPVERAWMGLAALLSRVTTPVFLGLVYFGAFVPIGLLLRAWKRNPLTRQRQPGTCWVARPVDARSRRDMQHQF
jgi:hypothetical protein